MFRKDLEDMMQFFKAHQIRPVVDSHVLPGPPVLKPGEKSGTHGIHPAAKLGSTRCWTEERNSWEAMHQMAGNLARIAILHWAGASLAFEQVVEGRASGAGSQCPFDCLAVAPKSERVDINQRPLAAAQVIDHGQIEVRANVYKHRRHVAALCVHVSGSTRA